ncbi:MAG: hypothetical protein M1833_004461 [Piccolia ochrophora]|nr:MAG: hypothetical protein M1833_004461 [Piccolia ochrophora]
MVETGERSVPDWGVERSNAPVSNVTTIKSPINDNISITYKEPSAEVCKTIFPTQRQYTGHVSLPPLTLAPVQQDYTINTFFWFVEARQSPETAPLTIWINGGPGSSSMVGLFQETGPCEVVELARGKFGTQARDWGWDRSSNMVFIDQPNQVGFSYDEPTNASLNLITNDYAFPPTNQPEGQPTYTYLNGTFSSNNGVWTTNTTQISAHAIWHMLQGFLSVFPQYNPGTRPDSNETGTVGINLFTESYGGKYGPVFARLWEEQNNRRANGSLPKDKTVDIELTSLGIINGCIDDLVQSPFYPIMASNNSYGIQAITADDAAAASKLFTNTGGCRDAINKCRASAANLDPEQEGDVAVVNRMCEEAADVCNDLVSPFTDSGRSIYDIAHKVPDPFPPSTYLEYLNSGEFLEAIGSSINYTEVNSIVGGAFMSTGDYERGAHVDDLAYLLSRNIRVALIYGDRDYSCNWLGGEAISFSLAATAPLYSPFYSAGYADIVVNDSYIGGQVRQFGNLSFSRIYDAGHLAPAYQPETAFTIFTRIIQGVSVAMGKPVDLSTFQTSGAANSTYQNKVPESPEPRCWIRNIQGTCSDFQRNRLFTGQGVVINGVFYNEESDWTTPPTHDDASPSSSDSSASGQPSARSTKRSPTGSDQGSREVVQTGVYVATGTIPDPPAPRPTTKKAAGVRSVADVEAYQFWMSVVGMALGWSGLL